jgi:hypothetical protein
MSRWSIATATTVGESHIQRGIGSDDAFATLQSGRWSALVVCDGAGSAARSREGANTVSSAFAKELIKISKKIEHLGPGPWLNDSIISSVIAVRAELATVAQSFNLSDFHCTLVAALVSDTGGFSVHIGDGAVFVGRRTNLSSQIELHSDPENGEYSNETFFVTETTWLRNLRIKPLGACDWVVITTDGAAALLLDRDIKSEVFSGLLEVLSTEKSLTKVEDDLAYFVESDYATACSNDDKSIVLAFRDFIALNGYNSDNLERAPLTGETDPIDPSVASKPIPSSKNQTKSHPVHSRPRNPLLMSVLLGFGSVMVLGALAFLLHDAWSEPRNLPIEMLVDPFDRTAAPCIKLKTC